MSTNNKPRPSIGKVSRNRDVLQKRERSAKRHADREDKTRYLRTCSADVMEERQKKRHQQRCRESVLSDN